MSEQIDAAIQLEKESGEFERSRVPDSAQKGAGKFWGMFAGEHAAGTEFMIGPLFLAAGASLQNLLVGLLIGNLLAVLTWRYLVAPIAVKSRYTLYYQLERIAGGGLVKFYNLINGVLFCFLAGAMVTVSATAVGIPFGVEFTVPENFWGLGSFSFTMIVLVVGAVIAVIAASGYDTVAKFANIAAPWMVAVFAACGLVALVQMGANNMESLKSGEFWDSAVAFVQEKNGSVDFGLGKIIIFSWLCNAAMHFGMADLSVFRFAKKASYGWASSIGMFLGHYMAWICAALLLAALIKTSPELAVGADGKVGANPGLLAHKALGWTGIIVVVIAGWTTANPTIYRAGLAFQGMIPKLGRWGATILAGAVATIAGAFPNVSAQLLGFVGTYGTILGGVGGIIFVNHYLSNKLGFTHDYAIAHKTSFNTAVALAWLIPVAVGLFMIFGQGLFAAYAVIPCWIASAVLYVIFAKSILKK